MVRKNLLICGLVAAVFVIASPRLFGDKEKCENSGKTGSHGTHTSRKSNTNLSCADCNPRRGAFETKARTAVMVDLSTGTILLEKDPDRPIPPGIHDQNHDNLSYSSN
ncbi:MAG: hypothetical protein R3E60_06620 [Alphaproteobacteria bacterium]